MADTGKSPPNTFEDFQAASEISREPEVPKLSDADIEKITETVFRNSNPTDADIAFVFGTSESQGLDWKLLAKRYKLGQIGMFVTTGLAGKRYYETGKPVGQMLAEDLKKEGVPSDKILIESESNNTLDNVRNGVKLLGKQGVAPQSVLLVAKAHHGGRAYLTLKKYLPGIPISFWTYDASYGNVTIRKSDWWKTPQAAKRVYGEYLRIKKYSERGDIAKE